MRVIFRSFLAIALLSSGVVSAHAPQADVVVTVEIFQDVVDDEDGLCSLREAIHALGSSRSGDCASNATIIQLEKGTYRLSIPAVSGDDPAGGDLDVHRAVTIRGAGRSDTTIDADYIDRIFEISATVKIQDLTLRSGKPEWFDEWEREDGGGAIYNTGTVTIERVLFTKNFAEIIEGEVGGAIDNRGQMTIRNADFLENFAYAGGGAIANFGKLTISEAQFIKNNVFSGGIVMNGPFGDLEISDTYFSENTSAMDGINLTNHGKASIRNTLFDCTSYAVEYGGTIWSAGETLLEEVTIQNCISFENGGAITLFGGSLEIARSILRENYSVSGGGIYMRDGVLVVRDSLLHANSAGQGGALYVENGSAVVQNSTLVENNADLGAVYAAGGSVDLRSVTISRNSGGGVTTAGGTAQLHNSILAGNFLEGLVQAGSECQAAPGGIVSLGYNLLGHSAGCEWVNANGDDTGNVVAPLDPNLGPLEDNGGPTWTVELQPGSPALDDGDNANCPDIDQRGMPRPMDGSGDGFSACDKGAYEVQRAQATPSPTAGQAATPTGTLTALPTPTQTPTSVLQNTETPPATPLPGGTPTTQPVEPTQGLPLPPVIYVPIVSK